MKRGIFAFSNNLRKPWKYAYFHVSSIRSGPDRQSWAYGQGLTDITFYTWFCQTMFASGTVQKRPSLDRFGRSAGISIRATLARVCWACRQRLTGGPCPRIIREICEFAWNAEIGISTRECIRDAKLWAVANQIRNCEFGLNTFTRARALAYIY